MKQGVRRAGAALAGGFMLALACGKAEPGNADPAVTDGLGQDDALQTATSETPSVVSGCEDVLQPRAELPRCDGDTCSQVQRETERVVHWLLVLKIYERNAAGQERELSQAERAHERDCVFLQLQSEGLAPEHYVLDAAGIDDIVIDASFAQIESVLRTSAISDVELSCAEADCRRCETLSEQECTADAFCEAVYGARIAGGATCIGYGYAGCYRGRATCTASLVAVWGPDGACWQFSNGCIPRGFPAASPDGTLCGYANFDGLSSCEIR
jgi:hypothetical protein